MRVKLTLVLRTPYKQGTDLAREVSSNSMVSVFSRASEFDDFLQSVHGFLVQSITDSCNTLLFAEQCALFKLFFQVRKDSFSHSYANKLDGIFRASYQGYSAVLFFEFVENSNMI